VHSVGWQGELRGGEASDTLQTIASIVGPLIGIASLIAAYIFYRRNRKYMELTYEVAPTLALLRVGSAIRHRVKVEYEGKQIEDLTGVSVAIRSTGTDPVEFSPEADTSGTQIPVTIDFGEDAQILGDPTIETSPSNLIVSVTQDPKNPHKVVANKFLLNPGQGFTISVFLTNYRKKKPQVYAQIRGVTLREQLTTDRTQTAMAIMATLEELQNVPRNVLRNLVIIPSQIPRFFLVLLGLVLFAYLIIVVLALSLSS
jgi:hypothetical protein